MLVGSCGSRRARAALVVVGRAPARGRVAVAGTELARGEDSVSSEQRGCTRAERSRPTVSRTLGRPVARTVCVVSCVVCESRQPLMPVMHSGLRDFSPTVRIETSHSRLCSLLRLSVRCAAPHVPRPAASPSAAPEAPFPVRTALEHELPAIPPSGRPLSVQRRTNSVRIALYITSTSLVPELRAWPRVRRSRRRTTPGRRRRHT